MDSKEIDERLAKGEKLFCPECDLYHDDEGQGVCEIIMCANPFSGCSDLDIEAHSKLITNNFKKRQKMSKKITFKENNSALTYQNNGNININPKFVKKFGNIVISIDNNGDIKLDPKGFIFDCKFEGIAIKIKKKVK